MLQNNDLHAFVKAFAESADPALVPMSPRDALSQDDGLFASEVWRLGYSLRIAAVLGDAPPAAAVAVQVIGDEMGEIRCAPLCDCDAWRRAIAWARTQPALGNASASKVPRGHDRELIVGEACLRLRNRGLKVEVGAFGPQISESSRREIVRSAEAYVSLLGGAETVAQILRFLRDAKLYHDGMWLFGEAGLNLHSPKRPMIPVGWLLSLAMRQLAQVGRARKPQIAWKSLIDLVTDFAAAHDCQRYSQFEGLNLHASQFQRTLANSILWRELFTLPQVPPKALRQILASLTALVTQDDQERLGFSFPALVKEVNQLVDRSADDGLTIHARAQAEQALPLLCRLTGGAAISVNEGYGDPLIARERNHEGLLLFAVGPERAVTLPRAFLAAAACEYVFRLVWSKLDSKRAEEIVGRTLEQAIAQACKGKAPTILTRHKYYVKAIDYDLDVVVCDKDRVVLIETKGKSLTRQSRSGDVSAYFKDYSESFLAMLGQLVRRDIHVRRGQSPLATSEEALADLRTIKVAVSPLSYGPVTDKALSNSILRSLFGATLVLTIPSQTNQKMIDLFNKRLQKIIADMVLVAPKSNETTDLFGYLMDVFWLDLGQLLYILDRAHTVWDAFQPLKHVTFGSRDFWTELAHADRQGMTHGKWRPVDNGLSP